MKIFWFSFSDCMENKGVCIVKADTAEEARDKIENLGLMPEHDDIFCAELNDLDYDPGMEFNVLYSSEEMIKKGYNVQNI